MFKYYNRVSDNRSAETAMHSIEVGDFLEIQENIDVEKYAPTNVVFVEVVRTRFRSLLRNDVDIWVRLPNGKERQLFLNGNRYYRLSDEMRAELTGTEFWNLDTIYYWCNYKQDMVALAEQMKKYPGSHVERRRQNLEKKRREKQEEAKKQQEEAKRQQLEWQKQQDAAKYVNDFFKRM